MPPFIPRKRSASDDEPSAKRPALSVDDAAPGKALAAEIPDSDADSVSSLSDAPSSEEILEDEKGRDADNHDEDSDGDDDGSDEVDWEDAMENTGASASNTTPVTPAVAEPQDLELTLDKNEVHLADLLDGKKAPTKIEREIRILTHCMHVQCLLFHNAIRNAWVSDPKVHEILRSKLPAGIQKEIRKWRVASGLEPREEKEEEEQPENNEKQKKGRKSKRQSQNRDWGDGSSRLEPGQPDMSRGDPVISLLKILAAYWKK